MTPEDREEILDILDSEFFSLGVQSGHNAYAYFIDTYLSGAMDSTLEEWGVTHGEFPQLAFDLAKKWIDETKMWKSHEDFYASSFLRNRG